MYLNKCLINFLRGNGNNAVSCPLEMPYDSAGVRRNSAFTTHGIAI